MSHYDVHDNSWWIVTLINGYADCNINKNLCHIVTCLKMLHATKMNGHNTMFIH